MIGQESAFPAGMVMLRPGHRSDLDEDRVRTGMESLMAMMVPTRRVALQALGAAATLPALQAEALGKPRPDGGIRGKMSGARALVETLITEGVGCVYGIPGAQENEFWDAMKQAGLPYLLSTHEFGAACMADGYARSTGRPGVLAVVPGPGVTNAASGLGEALLDSVPIVALVGDVARGEKYRPFQVHEIPVHLVLEGVTKKVLHCPDASQIPCLAREAFRLAMDGEPGPVAVMIPYTQLVDSTRYDVPAPLPRTVVWDQDGFDRAVACLSDRRCRVGLFVGQGCLDHAPLVTRVAEMLQAPVATTVSGKGAIDSFHPLSVGWGYGAAASSVAEKAFAHVDIVLAVSVRYSEVSTGFYSIPEHRCVIQVDSCADNIGQVVKVAAGVNSDAGLFLDRLLAEEGRLARPLNQALANDIAKWRHQQEKLFQAGHQKRKSAGIDPMDLVLALGEARSRDSMMFVDVTISEHWAAEAVHTRQPRTYFNPTDNQGMGWSIPAAIGAARVHPGRQVFTLTGDGCFLMAGQEISTAAREHLPVAFFIIDDHAYHYMQALQEKAYDRTTATRLARLDYEALARGYGVGYMEIGPADNLRAAVEAALATNGPLLVRVVAEYTDRPVRWLDATRKRYISELSVAQKTRFLTRLGSRALQLRDRND